MKKRILESFMQYGPRLLVIVASLVLVFQFAQMCGIMGRTATHRAQVAAFDDDGGMIIDRAVKTRWYKDNGVAGYGAFYFRLAHTLARAIGAGPLDGDSSDRHAIERTHHFVLMVISLLSVFLLSGLLASQLRSSWFERLVLTSCLVAALLASKVWSLSILRIHPDLLFAFFATLGTYLTFLTLEHPEREDYFKGSAVVWGLAVASKLSIVLYLPAFLILWMPPFRREGIRKTAHYFAWMFLSYFVVCFPQSIVFDRPIRFLLNQSQYSSTMTWDSLSEWLTLTWQQIWLPLLVLALAALAFPGRGEHRFRWRRHWRFVSFVFLPFLLLVTRRVSSTHDYYTIPFVAGFLLLFTLAISQVRGRGRLAPVVILVALCFWPKLVPDGFYSAYADQSRCRPEARELENSLVAKLNSGKKVYTDPYVPLDQAEFPGQVGFTWQITWPQVKAFDAQVIALNQTHLQAYFEMDTNADLKKYIQSYNPDLLTTQAFYRIFGSGGPEAQDPDGGTWTKTFARCDWVVWEKQ